MTWANRMVCAFPGSWLVGGIRPRTSTPALAAHPLLLYLVCDLRLYFAAAGATLNRPRVSKGEALV
jgi:hypothetical protein